jgi:site-specific DNA-methyltransferase (adenine-specific)
MKKYGRRNNFYKKLDWDLKIPDKNYFKELFRISNNQIIWGGNFMTENFPPSKCWIIWNKLVDEGFYSTSKLEMAWASFEKHPNIFEYYYKNIYLHDNKIHPTQKPIALYRWLLQNYAKPNDKIFDSHVGSASSFIACMEMGFNYTGIELDTDYFNESIKRIKLHEAKIKGEFYLPEEKNNLFGGLT